MPEDIPLLTRRAPDHGDKVDSLFFYLESPFSILLYFKGFCDWHEMILLGNFHQFESNQKHIHSLVLLRKFVNFRYVFLVNSSKLFFP